MKMCARLLTTLLALLCVGNIFAATNNTPATQAPSSASTPSPKTPVNGVITASQPIYTLHLKSNPTTGFSWFLVSYPKKSMSLIKHVYLPPNSKLIGAGGYEIWQFKANSNAFVAPQILKIKMMYARPWEINSQTPVQTFYVVTKA